MPPTTTTTTTPSTTTPKTKPTILILPGASQSPTHYAHLTHLLLLSSYPVLIATLPSLNARGPITAAHDAAFIRKSLLLPVLDDEKRDVVLLMHSYSGVPGSAAAVGLGQGERDKGEGEGERKGVVLGQVFLAALVVRGGDDQDVKGVFGEMPGHIVEDVRPAPLYPFFDREMMLSLHQLNLHAE